MKIEEITEMTNKYTAYVLNDTDRALLSNAYPPKYPEHVGHHVTVEFGVPEGTSAPEPANVKVVGYIDSGDGLEALVVSVNGSTQRPDGKTYHITWSLDRSKYSPKDSNTLLNNLGKRYTMIRPISVQTTPAVL